MSCSNLTFPCHVHAFYFYRSVLKLYSLRDSMRVFTRFDKREVALNQLPLFFLSNKNGFARLEIIPKGGFGSKKTEHNHYNSRRTLNGISSIHSRRINYRFPDGTDIEIRPYLSNPLTFRNGIQYGFDLGKSVLDT